MANGTESQSRIAPPEDIAIVGMANLFPGSDTPARFWQNILDKVECVSDPPPDWQAECFIDPSGQRRDLAYTARGGYLGDLARFDPLQFGVMPASMEGAEPDHFLVLKTAAAALRDAGFPEVPLNRRKCGVVLGRGVFLNRGLFTWIMQGYMVDQALRVVSQIATDATPEQLARIRAELSGNIPPFNADTVPGMTHCVLTGRIANRFDLNGPAYTLDAACASSLLAAEHGVEMLRSGRCDAALVGGSHVSNPGLVQLAFCHLGALSRKGRVAAFSAEADGTLLGQGCGVLVLKRLSDAERDGNRIYALLKAVGLSSDGNGAGLLAPRQEGQEIAIRRAYERAGLSPATVSLIEAHGTGIPLGDATELKSLSSVFGPRGDGGADVAIGSVKSMISHLVPAAGSASMMKIALALHHRVLPPTLHAEKLDPKLGLDQSRFYVNTVARPWIHGDERHPRRAGINAFGFGGSNAHAILEEYVPRDESALRRAEPQWPAELVVVRAAGRESLRARCESLASWVESNPSASLLDVAAAVWREEGSSRIAIVAKSCEELVRKLKHSAKLLAEADRAKIQDRSGIFWYSTPLARGGRVAFVFPGEGSQYVNMLAELAMRLPEVRRQFDLTDRAFSRLSGRAPLSRLIFPVPGTEAQAEVDLVQLGGAVTSVTAAGRALGALLNWLEICPDAVLGHSSGEFGALMAAGILPADDDEQLIRVINEGAESARAMSESTLVPPAVLTSVGGAPREAVDAVVAASGGRLQIAMENCPNQLVLVGDEDATAAALDGLRGKGGLCERLAWGRGYHTEAFRPATKFIDQFYRSIGLRAPRIETWSCATADRFPSDPAGVHALAVKQWHSPVRFAQTVRAMHDAGVRVFLEVGPRGNLSAFIADTLGDAAHAAIPLDLPRKNGIEQLCRALGMLAAHEVPLRLEKLFERREPKAIDLKTSLTKPRVEPRLRLDLPEFRVSEQAAAALKPPTRSPRASSTPQPPAGASPNGAASPTTAPAVPNAGAPVNGVAPAARAAQTGGPASPRQIAMLDFQRTMTDFLRAQQSIAARIGARGATSQPQRAAPSVDAAIAPPRSHPQQAVQSPAPAAPLPSAQAKQAQPTAAPGSAATATSATKVESASGARSMPFLHAVLSHEPRLRLVAECELDVDRYPFLLDHTFFGRPVSTRNPRLAGLPVAPLALTLELGAEAAVALGGASVVAIRDVQTKGWLAMDKSSRRVAMQAEARSPHEIHVVVREADKEGLNSEIIEAVYELGAEPQPLGAARVENRATASAPWARDLYGRTLYHGPPLAGLVSVERCDASGVLATVQQPSAPLAGADGQPLALVLPVAMLDTAAQTPSLVNANWSLDDPFVENVYPNGFKRLEWHLDSRWARASLTAVARVERDGAQLRSDVEFTAPDGTVALRALGRTDQVVAFPSWVYGGYRSPRRITATRDLTELFHDAPLPGAVRVCGLLRPADAILLSRIWTLVLARLLLSERELRAFGTRSGTPVSRLSWLLGRAAAKDAVRRFAGAEAGESTLCLADVEIETDAFGKPSASIGGGATPLISLSHKERYAVAAAGDPMALAGLGIDLEVAKRPADEVLADAFSDAERARIRAAGDGELGEDAALAMAWAAKEAAAKSLGRGLLGGPRSVEVTAFDGATGRLSVALSGELATAAGSLGLGDRLEAFARVHDDHVIALCAPGRGGKGR